MARMTDNDKSWGPFTWGRWKNYSGVSVHGPDEDDSQPRSYLRFIFYGRAIRVRLPFNLPECHDYSVHVLRLNGLKEGWSHLSVHYGRQDNSSHLCKSWIWEFPWKDTRLVRWSFLNLDGTLRGNVDRKKRYFSDGHEELELMVPRTNFLFRDYDGALIVANAYIEEREWRRGRGVFKHLLRFTKPLIRRTLELRFTQEVGSEKGSYKGGSIGHSTDIVPGQAPVDAFRKYCEVGHCGRGRQRTTLTFLREIPDSEMRQILETGRDAEGQEITIEYRHQYAAMFTGKEAANASN